MTTQCVGGPLQIHRVPEHDGRRDEVQAISAAARNCGPRFPQAGRLKAAKRTPAWQLLDNACSEMLFISLKVERLHRQSFVTRRQARDETIAWLLCYNKARLHSTLAYVSPMQFEEN